MSDPQDMVEVWKNTAAGMRWYSVIDRQGREAGRTVYGGRTFTLTPFDRQINQEHAASAGQDLFRNGTFVLIRPAETTIEDEIRSSDSFTDAELSSLVHEVLAKNKTIEQAIYPINSPVTLGRLLEQLVLEEAPKSMIGPVKEKKVRVEGGTQPAVEREFVAPAPPKEPEVKTPPVAEVPETPDIVVTQPEKV